MTGFGSTEVAIVVTAVGFIVIIHYLTSLRRESKIICYAASGFLLLGMLVGYEFYGFIAFVALIATALILQYARDWRRSRR